MGLFDFLSGGKGGNVKKIVARANNKDAQSIDRWKALEQLRDEGSDEAIAGLLRRFSFNYDKSIEDEQEKEWVHDSLVEMGERVLPSLEEALVKADSIAWPLKVLEHVVTDNDRAWPILEKVLAANDNQYTRDPSRKIQLINFLGEEFKDPRASKALVAYLEDVDEGVRYYTVEALLHQKDEEQGKEPLVQLLLKTDEPSRRIKVRILDGLADLGWSVEGHKEAVAKVCDEIGRHTLDNKDRIKKK